MPKEFKGTLEEQWPLMVKWMRQLPFFFRLTRIPFIGKYLFRDSFIGDPQARNWMVPVNERVETPDSIHLPLDILRPMIEKAAFRSQAPKCICRSSFECTEHPHDLACLFLGSAFENAHEEGLDHLSVKEAIEHVENAVNQGLTPTIVWDNDVEFFGEARDKGVAICLCCDCCCDIRLGLRMGTNEFRRKVFRPEGVSVVVSDECQLLGDCAAEEVCSVGAIRLGPTKAEIDLETCVGCGHCIQVCPAGAISFEFDPEVDVVGNLVAQVEQYTDIT
jgi:UDP-glucose 4-epimerase